MNARLRHLLVFMFAMSLSATASAKARSFALTLPLVGLDGTVNAKGEYNLGKKGGLGLELAFIPKNNYLNNDELDKHEDDELNMSGIGAAIFFAQYSDAAEMSGGYWSVGLGYRQMKADWKRTPDGSFAIAEDAPLDEKGRVSHELNSTGMTAHSRVGYRFIGDSFPAMVGIYAGIRHYQNEFKDNENAGDNVSVTAEDDREALKRRFMSALEFGLELGMAF